MEQSTPARSNLDVHVLLKRFDLQCFSSRASRLMVQFKADPDLASVQIWREAWFGPTLRERHRWVRGNEGTRGTGVAQRSPGVSRQNSVTKRMRGKKAVIGLLWRQDIDI